MIKEGYIRKRAEHLKDWRKRYFILKSNGDFIGYHKKPNTQTETSNNIVNNFTVKDCEVISMDLPNKKYTFCIRGLHLTTEV